MLESLTRRQFVRSAALSAGGAVVPWIAGRADTARAGKPRLVDQLERLAPAWPAPDPFPPPAELDFPEAIEHHLVESATDQFKFLHDPAVEMHAGKLFAAWYNCPEREIVGESLIRCRHSSDGGRTWSDREVIAADRNGRGIHYVPVQLLSHAGVLHAFVGTMQGGHDQIRSCALYTRNPDHGTWRSRGDIADRFLPNFAPVRMDDGNFIMAGRISAEWPKKPLIPAVAISRGEELQAPWTSVPLVDKPFPHGQCPETTLIVDGPQMIALTRNNNRNTYKPFVYTSRDFGRTWAPLADHTLRALDSKLYSGTLSTGQHFAIFNHPLEKAYRGTLAIAVSRPGQAALSGVWKVQQSGAFERGSKRPIMAHYPCAIEADGKLFVVYSARFGHTKSCELTVIPIASLRK